MSIKIYYSTIRSNKEKRFHKMEMNMKKEIIYSFVSKKQK
jgi:hypothetical protein